MTPIQITEIRSQKDDLAKMPKKRKETEK